MAFDRELFETRHGRVIMDEDASDKLIEIISRKGNILDFMERYHLTGLCEATEEQLKEYIEEVFGNG